MQNRQRNHTEQKIAIWVQQAQQGDMEAFDALVRHFQNLAVGYAQTILKDFGAAEDAAQEAFLEAFRNLPALREPTAFPGWLRQIVWKHCDRHTRRARLNSVPLTEALEITAPESGPAAILEAREAQTDTLALIARLPDNERQAVVLFYLGAYPQREIAEFLGVPTTTVVKRLQTARTRLKTWMVTSMENMQEPLHRHAPSLNESFVNRVMSYVEDPRGTPDLLDASIIDRLLAAMQVNGVAQVRDLIQEDNGYGDPLFYWLIKRDAALVEAFVAACGDKFDIFLACFFGNIPKLHSLLATSKELAHSRNARSWTPLDTAAHEGHYDAVQLLLESGAEPNCLQPLLWAAQNGYSDVVRLLLEYGGGTEDRGREALSRAVYRNRPAVVDVLLGHGVSAVGLLGAAAYGSRTRGKTTILRKLLEHGADVNERDGKGYTPLYSLISFYGAGPSMEIAHFLLENGAEVDIFTASGLGLLNHLREFLVTNPASVHSRATSGLTPLHFAAMGNQLEAAHLLVVAGADRNAVISETKTERPVDMVRDFDGHFVTCDTQPLREFLTSKD